ncbi:carbohydrate ABC transporter permease [Paenibacillus chartarius]|uniref:Carbohydrate ABC transporter permease n=1 Tax=Paenibacillus chartarius TaxID=747481 RepID=A0ABV6DJ87_9BACL
MSTTTKPWALALIYALLIAGSILMLLPFLWMISTSLKHSSEVIVLPPKWIPSRLQWQNYVTAWQAAPFGRYMINSVVVTFLCTVGELVTTILASFAFAKLRFYGRDALFAILLATMMVPQEMLLIPNYITLTELGWLDRYEALIIPWIASVFAIFLLRQYFLGIPQQLYYACRIDGCRDWGFLWRIMVPLSKPALVTIALLKAIGSWNAFLWPLIMTNSEEMRTMPVGLTAFFSETDLNYELLMAASMMIVAPMLLLYAALQRSIVEGISRGGLKG